MSLADLKSELIRQFQKTGSFKHQKEARFPLSSGRFSKYYVDCKQLLSHPHRLKLVAQLACEELKELEFECIGGREIGAIPISAIISLYAYYDHGKIWQTFMVRKEAKKHGLQKKVEGFVERGARAVVVDDVLTTGASVIEAVKAVQAEGMQVEHALVLVDRKDTERQDLEALGVELHSLLTIEDLLSNVDRDPVFS